MRDYKHTVQYYETDKMGITHHSNYIRWMEEARVDFLDQIGWSYAKFEEKGIISPVAGVECTYKKTSTFPETISIVVSIAEYNGVKIVFKYTMSNTKGEVIAEAKSTHCFIGANKLPMMIKKAEPELHETLMSLLNA